MRGRMKKFAWRLLQPRLKSVKCCFGKCNIGSRITFSSSCLRFPYKNADIRIAEVHRALDHVASRINAISLAHDQLAPQHEGQTVKLSDYLRALCSTIRQQVEEVEIDVACDELELSTDGRYPSASY